MFACNTSNQVTPRFSDDGVNWSAWSSLGGSCLSTPAATWSGWVSLGGSVSAGPTAIETAGGWLTVFANAGGTLYHRFYDPLTGGWSAWSSLGGTLETFIEPAVTESGGGARLVVVGRSSANQLTQKFHDNVTGRSGWTSLAGGKTMSSGPGAL